MLHCNECQSKNGRCSREVRRPKVWRKKTAQAKCLGGILQARSGPVGGPRDSISATAGVGQPPVQRRSSGVPGVDGRARPGLRGLPGGLEEAVKLSKLHRWWCGQLRDPGDRSGGAIAWTIPRGANTTRHNRENIQERCVSKMTHRRTKPRTDQCPSVNDGERDRIHFHIPGRQTQNRTAHANTFPQGGELSNQQIRRAFCPRV